MQWRGGNIQEHTKMYISVTLCEECLPRAAKKKTRTVNHTHTVRKTEREGDGTYKIENESECASFCDNRKE